jgi:hypothetical protein
MCSEENAAGRPGETADIHSISQRRDGHGQDCPVLVKPMNELSLGLATLPAQGAGLRQPSLSEALRLIGCLLFGMSAAGSSQEIRCHSVADSADGVAILP